MHESFPRDSEDEWRWAGGRLHTLQGLVDVRMPERATGTRMPPLKTSNTQSPTPEPLAESIWLDSYEAEQHLLHLGRSEEPVCWSLTGFASGYLSRAYGREVVCREERCRGKGDALCQVIGYFREDWGEEIEPELAYYQRHCLGAALAQVTEELKRAERKLRIRRGALNERERRAVDASGLVVQSTAMERILELAKRVAKVDSTGPRHRRERCRKGPSRPPGA